MTFVRTVLGDIVPADLGITYSHEHIVIDGGGLVALSPDFLLADEDRLAAEIGEAGAAGLRSAVDAMPIACGRNPDMLAELSRRTGVQLIAATGLHHERFYEPTGWTERATADELETLFVADIHDGIDRYDHRGSQVERTAIRAGVVKVAGSGAGLHERDRTVFRAAASAHLATGAPILTHCEAGTGALEQVRYLVDAGVTPAKIALSHVDKIVDRSYHRDILASGAFVEYDQSFRWPDGDNGTLRLMEWMVEDGFGGGILLGMDAARQGYYRAFGGTPGLAYLLRDFSREMAERGMGDAIRTAIFVDNPARAFSFGEVGQ